MAAAAATAPAGGITAPPSSVAGAAAAAGAAEPEAVGSAIVRWLPCAGAEREMDSRVVEGVGRSFFSSRPGLAFASPAVASPRPPGRSPSPFRLSRARAAGGGASPSRRQRHRAVGPKQSIPRLAQSCRPPSRLQCARTSAGWSRSSFLDARSTRVSPSCEAGWRSSQRGPAPTFASAWPRAQPERRPSLLPDVDQALSPSAQEQSLSMVGATTRSRASVQHQASGSTAAWPAAGPSAAPGAAGAVPPGPHPTGIAPLSA